MLSSRADKRASSNFDFPKMLEIISKRKKYVEAITQQRRFRSADGEDTVPTLGVELQSAPEAPGA